MNEQTPMLPPRLQETLEKYYSSAAPSADFASRLETQLRESMKNLPADLKRDKRTSLMNYIRTRPFAATLIIVILVLALSGVVYALGRSLGYIPGVGLVDQSAPVRILAEPVVAERDGLKVTVQVVADAGRTHVAYTVNGIQFPANGFPLCSMGPVLNLPDGSSLNFLGGGGGEISGQTGELMSYATTYDFDAIPPTVKNFTLFFPCILSEDKGPKNWEIPLTLIRAPEGYVTPGVEIGATYVFSGPKFVTTPTPTLEAASTPVVSDSSFLDTPTPVPNGSGLYLEQVIELPDSYLLVGNFADTGDLPGYVQSTGSAYDFLPRMEDANGNLVDYKVRDDIQPAINWGNVYYWAYEIPKPVRGPVKITLDQVDILVMDTIHFEFDTGENPQPGQKWQLDLPIHLGPYDYVIDTVEMLENGYLFRWHSGIDVPEGTSFQLDIVGSSQERGSAAGSEDRRPKDKVTYSQNITYLVPPPTGTLTVELTLYETVPLKGPWILTWTPPNQ